MDKRTIVSGFPIIDILTGGYATGEIVMVKVNEHMRYGDAAEHFILHQAIKITSAKTDQDTILTSFNLEWEKIKKKLDKIEPYSATYSKLYIHQRDTEEDLPTAKQLAKSLMRSIKRNNISVVIIDSVDDLLIFGDEDPKVLIQELLNVCKKTNVLIIISDYSSSIEERDLPEDITIIELNYDINLNIQAKITRQKNQTVIEHLYPDNEDLSLELVRTACKDTQNGRGAISKDKMNNLVYAASVIVNEIKKEMTGNGR